MLYLILGIAGIAVLYISRKANAGAGAGSDITKAHITTAQKTKALLEVSGRLGMVKGKPHIKVLKVFNQIWKQAPNKEIKTKMARNYLEANAARLNHENFVRKMAQSELHQWHSHKKPQPVIIRRSITGPLPKNSAYAARLERLKTHRRISGLWGAYHYETKINGVWVRDKK